MTKGPEAIRVAIRGGTPAVRAGLAALLAALDGFELLVEGTDEGGVDVVLAVGPGAARRGSAAPIIAMVETREEAAELLAAGIVAGAIAPDADGSQVAAAVTAIAAGLAVASPSLGLLPRPPAGSPATREGGEALTPRELEVLALIADGLPNKGIATRLGISENTVKFHAGSILAKLGAASRAEAVMLAARKGLLTV